MNIFIVYYKPRKNSPTQVIGVVDNENDAKEMIRKTRLHEQQNGWDELPKAYVKVRNGENVVIQGDDVVLLT